VNWIRVSVGVGRDASVGDVARACGVSRVTTTGHWVLVLTAMAEGCVDGDLSRISDDNIEEWADWRGKRGRFADAVRRYLCDDQGVMRSWGKYNGAKIREMEADRDRKKAARLAAIAEKKSGGRPAEQTQTSGGRPPLRDETRRDVTNNNKKQQIAADADAPSSVVPVVSVAKPATKYPGFTVETCNAAYDLWLERAGAVDYAQFRKAFGPVFAKAEADRPTALPRDAELIPLVRLYLSAIRGTSGAKFVKPEACAKAIAQLAVALRTGESPEHRLSLAQHALGLTDEIRRLARAA
jgi:hypothetical protein